MSRDKRSSNLWRRMMRAGEVPETSRLRNAWLSVYIDPGCWWTIYRLRLTLRDRMMRSSRGLSHLMRQEGGLPSRDEALSFLLKDPLRGFEFYREMLMTHLRSSVPFAAMPGHGESFGHYGQKGAARPAWYLKLQERKAWDDEE